jgi:hypothetical protein
MIRPLREPEGGGTAAQRAEGPPLTFLFFLFPAQLELPSRLFSRSVHPSSPSPFSFPAHSPPAPLLPLLPHSNPSSTPFSVASAASAAVFVPGGVSLGPPVGEGGSGAQTPGGTVIAAKSAAAAEFVPRRAATCVSLLLPSFFLRSALLRAP